MAEGQRRWKRGQAEQCMGGGIPKLGKDFNNTCIVGIYYVLMFIFGKIKTVTQR